MRRNELGQIIFSPSDLIGYMESEVRSWLDRHKLEFPDELHRDDDDEQAKLLQKRGLQHEAEYLQSLQSEGLDVCVIEGESEQIRLQRTIEAMKQGRAVIYQGVLQRDTFAGIADFLKKVPGSSTLGDYHYEVWDTKLALKSKPYFLIQLCCYAEMLEVIQGVRPHTVGVILGNKEPKSYRTDDYFFYYRQLKNAFLELQVNFDRNSMPDPSGLEDFGRWSTHIKNWLEETDHLSRVANIRHSQIKKLKAAGISTMRALAETPVARIAKLQDDTFQALKHQAQLQIASAGCERPKYAVLKPLEPRRGLELLPPASKLDVYFDMEGNPLTVGGLEYLFGVTHLVDGQPQFDDWWAHDRAQEKHAFEGFIDWVYSRWQSDPNMHIYHYGHYERTALRKLMGSHGTRESEVDDLLKAEVFVDLFAVVRQGLRIGEPSYSIKYVEHLYGPKRSGSVSTAADSVVQYHRWIESKENGDWRDSSILSAIRSYNKDDCDSTWRLTEWLRAVQRENNIAWIPKETKDRTQPNNPPAIQPGPLAERLLNELANSPSPDSEQNRVKELLAHSLEFHRRELKPGWWRQFERREMSEEELYDDLDCLAGLVRTSTPPAPEKRSRLFEYSFDPDQDTKLAAGKNCLYAHDVDQQVEIHSFNAEKGLLTLKIGPSKSEPPPRFSLIPDEYVNPRIIVDSIARTVDTFASTGVLPSALEDFLYRRPPRLQGRGPGPIIRDDQNLLEESILAAEDLNQSTLCIQGPPGSGKTYTAAHIIMRLLKLGKRIGVSSNSHKAICKLLETVIKEGQKTGQQILATKVGEVDDSLAATNLVAEVSSIKDVFTSGAAPQLIGGTAYAFSNAAADGQLDYLFVDEAGQVSLANLTGMTPSTKNIILIGDQMQLSQPIQGTHPGESGKSLLDYLLDGKATVPPDFGIFLSTTRRMHPDVCNFISGAIYEDRLHSHPTTSNRILVIPDDSSKQIVKRSGIHFVPLAHQGNSQGSDEEARRVKELVNVLLKCRIIKEDGVTEKQLALDDILIVAPYNLQVRKIKALIPGAKVGSVDKFQGQEAAVVIVSMCASDCESSARGLDFLFDKNRLNVAISRAQTLAVIVASPALTKAHCTSVAQMDLSNLFCRIVEAGTVVTS